MNKSDSLGIFSKPIAHRGFWTEGFPENTVGAFERAIERGYPIETDIQLSADNEVAVFHDSTLDRLTQAKGKVIEKPYNELKKINIQNSGYTIPLFKELLELADGKVPLLIEIKNTCKNDILCHKTLELLKGYKGEFAIQSFNPYIVKYFAVKAPQIVRGQLAAFDYGKDTSKINAFLLKRMFFNRITKPHFVSYNAVNLPNRFTDKCRKKGIKLLAWTVRSPQEYERIKNHADNIIFEQFEI